MSLSGFLGHMTEFMPPERVITDDLRRLAYGSDASFYRLIPEIVLIVETLDEVQAIVRAAGLHGVPVTFRAAGTSLSGQAITDAVLVLLGKGWNGIDIRDRGDAITLQPGVIGAHANRSLQAFGRKIGPDPASINAAKIGGIVANNASGMCCGTAHNSYQTLRSMKVVLADGTLLDTGDGQSVAGFRLSHAQMCADLRQIVTEVKNDQALTDRIRRKYQIKNTCGYALNALVDFDDDIDVLQHLIVGSEGTLGFIAEVTLATIADHPAKAAAMVYFADPVTASEAACRLAELEVDAVEMIDRRGLESVADTYVLWPILLDGPQNMTALLIETRADSRNLLNNNVLRLKEVLTACRPLGDITFTTDRQQIDRYWALRKGLFPAIGAVRPVGTTVIIEDIAVPLPYLGEAVVALQQLFDTHGYVQAVIFGHALAGNLHFVFAQAFESAAEIERYSGFMEAVTDMVAGRFSGSLKAEHGTGRNMAPFVEREWGAQAYAIMRRIKALFDPDNIFNPGVILSDNPKIHLQNLKPMPPADPLIDACMECGFCEPVCPSQALTLTPRQRIVTFRELSRLKAIPVQTKAERSRLDRLFADYQYSGMDTCAACSLCSSACPVGINTGDLIKSLRGDRIHPLKPLFSVAETLYPALLTAGALGTYAVGLWNRLAEALKIPAHSAASQIFPSHRRSEPARHPDHDDVVYFPSCVSRTIGGYSSQATDDLANVTIKLLEHAGYNVLIPGTVENLCCGMPFQSQGLPDLMERQRARLESVLWEVSDKGRIPVYVDTSPCSLTLRQGADKGLRVFDSAEFLARFVVPRLSLRPIDGPVMVHQTCSSSQSGEGKHLMDVVRACSREYVVPDGIACCGFAGDKGFTTPELNASALAGLRSQVPRGCTIGVSTSRTCELGLSVHSGVPYKSLAHLVLAAASAGSVGADGHGGGVMPRRNE